MQWLVTLRGNLESAQIDELLGRAGGERGAAPPIPLDDSQQVVEVMGPRDLPQKLQMEKDVFKVSPNSTLTLF